MTLHKKRYVMIITCPKCKTSYEVDDKLISEETKKVHCSNCGEIWVVEKEKAEKKSKKVEEPKVSLVDTIKKEPTIETPIEVTEKIIEQKLEEDIPTVSVSEEPILDPMIFKTEIKRSKKDKEISTENIDEIFSSFSIRSDKHNDEDYEPAKKKKHSGSFINIFFFLLSLLIIIGFCLYYLRFDISKNYPQTRDLYERLGIESTYFGQGLVFEDVTKLEYDDGFFPQMIVTGFIKNTSKEKLGIPTISVKLLDERKTTIQEIKYHTRVKELETGGMTQFDVSLDKPLIPVKYIVVTFTK